MKAQRAVWGDTVAALAASDENVVVLDGDLATSTKATSIADAVPEQFVQVGIAEQNMVGMAFGLSTLGYRPWLSSFGVFLTHRAADQVRMLVSQTKAPVRLAASYTGLLNGSSGKTHQDIEDLAIMRAMPHMTVIAPADEVEMEQAVRWADGHDGPVYLRIAREPVDPVFGPEHVFAPGRPELVTGGDEEADASNEADVTLVSTGVQTSRTWEAVRILARAGVRARLIHLPTLKPLDEGALMRMIGDADQVITVEEHSRIGGLGGLVSEVVSAHGGRSVVRIGLEDAWSESAPSDFLLDRYGLSPERVAEQVLQHTGVPA